MQDKTEGSAFADVPRAVWVLTLAVLAVHLLVAGRYDFFRNELYFIICGRHPAFGYADQPPLAPLVAAATQVFGENLFLLRLPAALMAAALVPLTAAFAALLGAGWTGRVIAGLAIVLAPGLTAMSSTFGTSTFEPVGWTLCAYLVVRGVVRAERAAFVWAGVAAGITFEAKFGVAIWVVGLAAGALLTRMRGALWSRGVAEGAAVAVAIGAPTVIWQAAHGFPFQDIVAYHSAEGRIFTGSFGHFLHAQMLAMNILLVPLWVAGIAAPFFPRGAAAGRIPAAAFVVAAAVIFVSHGKGYYLFAAYPAVFASGAVAAERLGRWWLVGWGALTVANAALIAPITLPLLEPSVLRAYMLKTHIVPAPSEVAGIGASITQVFSDEFGWRELAAQVGAVYRQLPEQDRPATGIFAWNYGEAGALEFFGAASGLPRVMSGEDQYYFWGPQGVGVKNLILVNVDADVWRPRCSSLQEVGRFGVRFAMPYEDDRAILLCKGLVKPLDVLWPDLRWVHAK
jgi:hypothetical protein